MVEPNRSALAASLIHPRDMPARGLSEVDIGFQPSIGFTNEPSSWESCSCAQGALTIGAGIGAAFRGSKGDRATAI